MRISVAFAIAALCIAQGAFAAPLPQRGLVPWRNNIESLTARARPARPTRPARPATMLSKPVPKPKIVPAEPKTKSRVPAKPAAANGPKLGTTTNAAPADVSVARNGVASVLFNPGLNIRPASLPLPVADPLLPITDPLAVEDASTELLGGEGEVPVDELELAEDTETLDSDPELVDDFELSADGTGVDEASGLADGVGFDDTTTLDDFSAEETGGDDIDIIGVTDDFGVPVEQPEDVLGQSTAFDVEGLQSVVPNELVDETDFDGTSDGDIAFEDDETELSDEFASVDGLS